MVVEHLEVNPEDFIDDKEYSFPLFRIALHLWDAPGELSYAVDGHLQIQLGLPVLIERVCLDSHVFDQPGEVPRKIEEPHVQPLNQFDHALEYPSKAFEIGLLVLL